MQKKNQKLVCAIVLGLMLAVPVGASAAESIRIDGNSSFISDDSIEIIANKDVAGYKYGIITTADDSNISLTGNDIKISSTEVGDNFIPCAVWSYRGSIILGRDDSNITIDSQGNEAIGLEVYSDLDITGNEVKISASGSDVTGVDVMGGSIGTGFNNINAKTLIVEVNGETDDDSAGFVIANNTDENFNDLPEQVAKVNIEAENMKVVSSNMGFVIYSNGQLDIDSNLVADAKNLIVTRGYAITNINTNSNKTAQLTGDIVFLYDSKTSGTTIEAKVNLNLNNDKSYFVGNIYKESAWNDDIPDGLDIVTGMQLGLANGAQWTTDADSFVNTLNFNGGIININGGENHSVQLDKVEGNGGTVNIKAEIEDGGSVTSGKLNIGKEETAPANALFAENAAPKINVNFTGLTADSFEDANAAKQALNSLAGNVSVTGGEQVSATASIEEGIVNGAVSGEMIFGTDGSGNGAGSIEVDNIKVNTSTTTMDNMRDIASVALVAWRQEDSTLSQRLGELRSSEGDQGIWARMSRGEFEYGGAFKNQYNYFQLGYDWAAKDWHYGAAISHNDGQTTYANGSGENDSTSLTLYGTWLGDKGQYTDIVVKQGKLNNEFTNYAEAGTTTGDYDMWGTSISAEYGQKLEMKNDWYVTPQAQLTYMRIGGEDYTATVTDGSGNSAPMYVSQDGMDSFVGRIGFEAGKNISEKGSIYAKASLLHEFAGEADTTLLYDGKNAVYSQDLGDTWYECGFGVNYKTSDSSYVYADVVKTFGGDVETPWQWNAGMRFTF